MIRPVAYSALLAPPCHPAHSHCIVAEDGVLAIDAPFDVDRPARCSDPDRAMARALLDEWQARKPDLDSAEVQDWICRVLGYYYGCYADRSVPEPDCWDDDRLVHDLKRLPLTAIDDHAGVHWVRRYYPTFTPTADHFTRAYWSNR